jgi:hypothetical protein
MNPQGVVDATGAVSVLALFGAVRGVFGAGLLRRWTASGLGLCGFRSAADWLNL